MLDIISPLSFNLLTFTLAATCSLWLVLLRMAECLMMFMDSIVMSNQSCSGNKSLPTVRVDWVTAIVSSRFV